MIQQSLLSKGDATDYGTITRALTNMDDKSKYGTFKDSLRAPIYRWFTYPAGYSYKLVEEKIKESKIGREATILDPFVGTGTTLLVAKQNKINSIGIEAHPFVYWIAQTKLFWEFDYHKLSKSVMDLTHQIKSAQENEWRNMDVSDVPELLKKCYSEMALQKLHFILEIIKNGTFSDREKDFFRIVLAASLRIISAAGTGWPYIAPSKFGSKKSEKDVFPTYIKLLDQFYGDLDSVKGLIDDSVLTKLVLGDARSSHGIQENSIDLLVTSPPYLNNYDYADRTRLETYFFGIAKNWGDITKKIRSKLMIAATTQVSSTQSRNRALKDDLRKKSPQLYEELAEKIDELAKTKLTKGGKKNYDWLATGYFNDIFDVMQQLALVMKRGSKSVWILGDSAPYGIHFPTEEYIGRLAVAVGFGRYGVEVLRARGDKWSKNPQRHNVKLKESILTIWK